MVILSGGRRWKSERGAVEKVAVWLRKKLGLTIIGFDIMVSLNAFLQSIVPTLCEF